MPPSCTKDGQIGSIHSGSKVGMKFEQRQLEAARAQETTKSAEMGA
jgi:hypothetical protein